MTNNTSGLSRYRCNELSTTQLIYRYLQYLVVPLTLVVKSICVFFTKGMFFSFVVCRGWLKFCHGAVNFTVLLTPPTQWMENEEHFSKVGFIQRVLAKFSISNNMNIALKLFPINSTNKTLVTFWIHLVIKSPHYEIWLKSANYMDEFNCLQCLQI